MRRSLETLLKYTIAHSCIPRIDYGLLLRRKVLFSRRSGVDAHCRFGASWCAFTLPRARRCVDAMGDRWKKKLKWRFQCILNNASSRREAGKDAFAIATVELNFNRDATRSGVLLAFDDAFRCDVEEANHIANIPIALRTFAFVTGFPHETAIAVEAPAT